MQIRTSRSMIRTLLLPFILTGLVFLSSCKKQRQARWMYYDETSCADPWSFTNNNEVLKDNVIAYYEAKGITIYEMEIFRQSDAEACLACSCKTGRRYKLKVKKSDVSEAKAAGLIE